MLSRCRSSELCGFRSVLIDVTDMSVNEVKGQNPTVTICSYFYSQFGLWINITFNIDFVLDQEVYNKSYELKQNLFTVRFLRIK